MTQQGRPRGIEAGGPPCPPKPDRGQRRYHVSVERRREFARLTPYERLKRVEGCSAFVRMRQEQSNNW